MRLEATVEISAHRFLKPSCALKSPAKCDAGVGILPSSESCLICLGCSLGPEILRAPQLILMCGQSWKFWPNCLKCKWGNGDPKYINAPYAQGQLSTGLGLDLGHLAANLMLSPQHAWCPSAKNAGGPTLGREKEAAGFHLAWPPKGGEENALWPAPLPGCVTLKQSHPLPLTWVDGAVKVERQDKSACALRGSLLHSPMSPCHLLALSLHSPTPHSLVHSFMHSLNNTHLFLLWWGTFFFLSLLIALCDCGISVPRPGIDLTSPGHSSESPDS